MRTRDLAILRRRILGKDFIVHSIFCYNSNSGIREELYFQTHAHEQSKIKGLSPL
jgi:hypothetical protein